MSVKSWNKSETPRAEAVENVERGEHILLKEVTLEAGSRIAWVIKTVTLYILTVVLLMLSCNLGVSILSDLQVNAIFFKYACFLSYYLLIPGCCATCVNIMRTEFTVVDDCLCDVDLWTVTKVRYDKHHLYLDKYRIDCVPNGRKLYDALYDYYYNMTGGELP